MIVYTSNKEKLKLSEDPIASGAEGVVHKVIHYYNQSRFANTCVKIYFKERRSSILKKKIEYMVRNMEHIFPQRNEKLGYMICWPQDIIFNEDNEFIGFVMPLAFEGCMPLTIITTTNISRRIPQEWHEKYGRGMGSQTVINRLKLINNLLIPIVYLHSLDKYVLFDFKPENILITSTGRVCIIDMDSIQIKDGPVFFRAGAATPHYIPPEYYSSEHVFDDNTIVPASWDIFALGVILYRILFGIHPYAAQLKRDCPNDTDDTITYNISQNLFPFGKNGYRVTYPPPHTFFKTMPKKLQDLFISTFSSEIENRPNAITWIKGVREVLEEAKKIDPIPAPKPKPKPKPKPAPKPVEHPRAETPPSTPPPAPKSSNNGALWAIILIIVAIIIIWCASTMN